jgi:competence protein ComEA
MTRLILALLMCIALAGTASAVVNINTATKEELTTVKGIGENRAQQIIDYRKKNGDFKSVDDLEKVPGIGPGTMKQIRSQVTVSGKTATEKPADKGTKAKSTAATSTKKSETLGGSMKSDPAKTKSAEKASLGEKKTEKK